MDCEHCTEYLADFLLDELPEGEAVLIQEHLNLCPPCMRRYKELKGTGKALEAVPAMRAVQGSKEFTRVVHAGAAVESQKIIEALPAEKRVRVEARRAARNAKFSSQRMPGQRMSRVWSLVAALSIGVLALFLIFSSGRGMLTPRTQIGALTMTAGPVETANIDESHSNAAAREAQNIYLGDRITTADGGHARIELKDGTSLFVGPNATVTLQPLVSQVGAFQIVVDKGELGITRPLSNEKDPSRTLLKWEVQSDLGLLLPDPGAQLFVSIEKTGGGFNGSALVVAGSTTILSRTEGTETTATLTAGSRYLEGTGKGKGRTEQAGNARVPGWRVDMVSEADLQRLLNGRVKLVKRSGAGLDVEVVYSRDNKKMGDDWIADPAGASAMSQGPDAISMTAGRLRHTVPFAAPVNFAVTLNRAVRPERNLAFGALYDNDRGVSVDVEREATLQVRIKDTHAHSASIPARKEADHPESLTLDIGAENGGLSATVSNKDGKTPALKLPPEFEGKSGQLWIQALNDGLTVDEIRISGTIPSDWLSEALSKSDR